MPAPRQSKKAPRIANESAPCRCGSGLYCHRHLTYRATKTAEAEYRLHKSALHVGKTMKKGSRAVS